MSGFTHIPRGERVRVWLKYILTAALIFAVIGISSRLIIEVYVTNETLDLWLGVFSTLVCLKIASMAAEFLVGDEGRHKRALRLLRKQTPGALLPGSVYVNYTPYGVQQHIPMVSYFKEATNENFKYSESVCEAVAKLAPKASLKRCSSVFVVTNGGNGVIIGTADIQQ